MNYITRAFTLHMSGVQYWSAFQSSNLIGWVEVNLGCYQLRATAHTQCIIGTPGWLKIGPLKWGPRPAPISRENI